MDGQVERFSAKGSNIDNAAQAFQTALLSGISSSMCSVNTISTPPVSSFPKCKDIYIKGETATNSVSIGYINIPIIKHIHKAIRVRRALKRIMKPGVDYHIVIYGIHSPFLLSLMGIKRDKYKSCLIAPDLPEFMSESKNVLYRIAKRVDRFIIDRQLKNIDCYVLFSELMLERLKIERPHIVIEGIYQNGSSEVEYPTKDRNKVVFYSGTLDYRYGIMNLIKAFESIQDPSYKLWICGQGNSADEIKKHAKKDQRIKYLGVIPRNEVLILQRQATVLVNPRSSAEEYTKYSFPSKTMEYLASGTPTIMSHLKSIPSEYDSHIYYLEDESVDGIRDKIISVCNKPADELASFGEQASTFIKEEKNNIKQANKLITFLKTIS